MDWSQAAQSGKGHVMGLFPLDLKRAGSRRAGNLVAVLSLFSLRASLKDESDREAQCVYLLLHKCCLHKCFAPLGGIVSYQAHENQVNCGFKLATMRLKSTEKRSQKS